MESRTFFRGAKESARLLCCGLEVTNEIRPCEGRVEGREGREDIWEDG